MGTTQEPRMFDIPCRNLVYTYSRTQTHIHTENNLQITPPPRPQTLNNQPYTILNPPNPPEPKNPLKTRMTLRR